MIQPPWTTVLTQSEHDLILFGMVAAALALLATLVRVRFASNEARGTFQVASLTANAVVALALVAYVTVIASYLVGYTQRGALYYPNAAARLSWELRYMDWVVTVPLLVIELIAVSSLNPKLASRARWIGMISAVGMIAAGFLGAFIINSGTDRTSYTLFGVIGGAFFAVLYALFVLTLRTSLPRLPDAAREPYRASVVLLLLTWLIYPTVYGLIGVTMNGAIVVIAQLALCAADMIAKIGYGTLVHRTSVLRSRNEEDLDPSTVRRPRPPLNESIYVTDTRRIDFDDQP